MLWILVAIGGIVAFLLVVSFIDDIFSGDIDWDDIRNYGIKMIICIALGLIGVLGLHGIKKLSYDELVQTGICDLVSITDDSQISGKGSGVPFYLYVSIDTEEVYSFYYQVNDNGFKRGKVNADETTIYENDDCTPYIVEYTTYTKSRMNKFLRILLSFGYGESSHKRYEIHVPTGTILRTFNLDLQ